MLNVGPRPAYRGPLDRRGLAVGLVVAGAVGAVWGVIAGLMGGLAVGLPLGLLGVGSERERVVGGHQDRQSGVPVS